MPACSSLDTLPGLEARFLKHGCKFTSPLTLFHCGTEEICEEIWGLDSVLWSPYCSQHPTLNITAFSRQMFHCPGKSRRGSHPCFPSPLLSHTLEEGRRCLYLSTLLGDFCFLSLLAPQKEEVLQKTSLIVLSSWFWGQKGAGSTAFCYCQSYWIPSRPACTFVIKFRWYTKLPFSFLLPRTAQKCERSSGCEKITFLWTMGKK